MVNAKAVNIIRGLNRKELLKFEKFIDSPYFNSNTKLKKLYKILKNFYPDFESPQCNKENIYKYVYDKENFSDEKLRKLFSDLYKLAEKYLVVLNLERNRMDYSKLLLEELDSRKIDNVYLSKYNEAAEYLNKIGYHYQIFLRSHELKWQNVSFHLSRGEQFKLPPEIFERSEQLIFYFLSDLFITLNDIDMNKLNFNYAHPQNLPQKFVDNLNMESIYKYIRENDFRNKEIFSLYYFAFLMNKHFDNEHYFFQLKKSLDANIDKLNKPGKMNFVLLMINYCNLKMKKSNNLEFEKEKLILYDKLIKYELYDSNYFRTDVFLNIFMTYLRHGKVAEANTFIEDNIRSINPAHSKSLISLCKASILFETGKYQESLAIAAKIRSNMLFIKIYLRKLLMKIDYELHEFDTTKDSANNYRQFIVGTKIIGETNKNILLEFIRNYNDLIKLKIDNTDGFMMRELKKKIDTISDGLDREWFTKKIESIG
ncbi:MAG: hypothetical protein ABI792_01205 [bacterium]